jgi:hypothetical protein
MFIVVPMPIVVIIFSNHVPAFAELREFLSSRGSEANRSD